ncbi:MAG: EF-hand domain-containing protein [Sphingobium sp.]|nr:EF-hand domain-containing protein [Sphingobium sp.]
MAQQAQTTPPADSTTTQSTNVPEGTASGTGAASSSATSSTSAGATANNAAQVSALVDKEFPAYDADKSGQLDKNEFSTWILALKADELKATGKTMAQTEMASWASAAFTSADTDKSTTVTKAELGKFLGG